MRDILVSVAVLLLVICFVIFYACEAKKNSETAEVRDEIETRISDYRREKKELTDTLRALEEEHHRETVGASRLMLVFNTLNNEFKDEIHPILKEKGIYGTICLDPEILPGVYSVISKQELESLLLDGWQTAVCFDGKKAVNGWYVGLEDAFLMADITIPEVVLVDSGNYTEEIEASLLALGFKDVIVSVFKPDIERQDLEGMRITDGVGWYTSTASGLINTFASKTGDAAFIVGGETLETKYEESQFSAMLDTISKSIEKEQLFLTTPREAAEYKAKLKEAYERTITEHTEKKTELETRIKELETLIENVYDEYIDKK